MKFGTSEPHNCFEVQAKILTEQSTELSTSSPGSVWFPIWRQYENREAPGDEVAEIRNRDRLFHWI